MHLTTPTSSAFLVVPRSLACVAVLASLITAQSWVLRTPPSSPGVRNSHGLAFDDARGRAVLFGGYDAATPGFGDTWEWDGQSWLAQTPSVAPSARWGHQIAYDRLRRRAVLFGGYNSASGLLADTWEWDGVSWTLRATPSAPLPRAYYSMVFDRARGLTVLFGGHGGGQNYFGDTWTWDGLQWSVKATSIAPGPRRNAAMAYDVTNQNTVLFGGGTTAVFADTWTWNGTAWLQRSPASSPSARWASHATFDEARGKVQLFGGASLNFATNHADTWEWNGTTWTQLGVAPPAGRHGHATTYDSWRGNVVMFGGRSTTSFLNATLEFPPSPPAAGWQMRFSGGPPERVSASMACDLAGNAYIFGGCIGIGIGPPIYAPAHLWRWNGSMWLAGGGGGPSARGASAMTFDRTRNELVLFGGFINGGAWTIPIADTWIWNGTIWSAGTAGPPARSNHSMTFDRVRSRVVLFGGVNSASQYLGDTWEWNGSAWQSMTSALTPSARAFSALAFDPTIGRTVMHGGRSNAGVASDTWEWDGVFWTLASSAGPFRANHVMAYDTSRGRIVLYGGTDASNVGHSEVWERTGNTWIMTGSGPIQQNTGGLDYDEYRQRLVLFQSSALAVPEIWEDVPGGAIVAASVPYGLSCGALSLVGDPQARPVIGMVARAIVQNVNVAFVAAGWSRSTFGGLTIPVSLTASGLTGCDLLQSMDIMLGTTPIYGGRQFQLLLPNATSLLGQSLFIQAVAPLPGSNPAGLVVSNGLEWRFGNL